MNLALLILLSAAFVITHILLSHGRLRETLVGGLGEWPFRGLYSLVALATFAGAAVIFWNNRHLGPLLWQLPYWLELAVALPLTLLAVVLIVLAFATPSPSSMIPAPIEVRGVLRITRHPMNMGFACFGLAHILANGAAGDVAFFGSLMLLGVIGPFHLDRRKARERGHAFSDFVRQTSVIPFAAVLTGRTRLVLAELPFPMVAVAAVAWLALVFFHGRLFGASLW